MTRVAAVTIALYLQAAPLGSRTFLCGGSTRVGGSGFRSVHLFGPQHGQIFSMRA
jgi:hypothetical protein